MNVVSRFATRDPAPDHVERFRGSHSAILVGLGELRRLPMLSDALQEARLTAESTLALFQCHILPHHLEEEQELFVAVRCATQGPEREHLEELLARLVAQHRRLEDLWVQLRPSVLAIAEGKVQASPTFREDVKTLVDACLDHTRLEERVFLPWADEILSRSQDRTPGLDPSEHMRHAVGKSLKS